MDNKQEVLSMIRLMEKGCKFVEIPTYLKNHTTLDEYQRKVVAQNLSAIQRRLEDVHTITSEILDFC